MKKATLFVLICFFASCSDDERSPSILTITPGTGNFEQDVTIAGSNFSVSLLDNEVTFNGTRAVVKAATANELVVTVPVNSTSGKISVKSQGRQVISGQDFIVTSGGWASRAASPENAEATNASVFSSQGKAFVVFGQVSAGGVLQDATFYQFDPATNAWTPKTIYDKSFSPVMYASWGSASGKGFVLEPYGGDLHVYDVATDTWSVKQTVYTVDNGDEYPVLAFNIGDDGYVLLSDNNLWKYNITGDSWSSQGLFTGELNYSREIFGMATNTKGYIGNGTNLWEFNPANKQWTQKANRSGEVYLMFATNDRIYAGDYSTADKGLWEYNVDGNTWTRKASLMGNPRYSEVVFGVGSKGYVGMGAQTADDRLVKDFYEYTPAGGLD